MLTIHILSNSNYLLMEYKNCPRRGIIECPETLSLHELKKIFLAYKDDKAIKRNKIDEFHTLLELWRDFEGTVKSYPHKYIDFIENELLPDDKINLNYILYGLNGLVKAEFSSNKVKKIFEGIIRREDIMTIHLSQLIWNTSYLISEEKVGRKILDFLIKIAQQPSSREYNSISGGGNLNLYSQAINRPNGAALREILHMCPLKLHGEEIIDCVKTLTFNTNDLGIKAVLLGELAHVNHLDKELGMDLFCYLIETNEKELLKSSILSASYFIFHDYKRLENYLKSLLSIEETSMNAGRLITNNYIHNYSEETKKLIEDVINSNNIKAKEGIIRLISEYMEDEQHFDKCFKVLVHFFNETNEEIISELCLSILHHFKPEYLPIFKEYIKKMLKNNISTINTKPYIFKYILKCSRYYPKDCIDVIHVVRWENSYDMHGHIPSIEIILNCYGQLKRKKIIDEDVKRYLKSCMDELDKMLLNTHIRNHNDAVKKHLLID